MLGAVDQLAVVQDPLDGLVHCGLQTLGGVLVNVRPLLVHVCLELIPLLLDGLVGRQVLVLGCLSLLEQDTALLIDREILERQLLRRRLGDRRTAAGTSTASDEPTGDDAAGTGVAYTCVPASARPGATSAAAGDTRSRSWGGSSSAALSCAGTGAAAASASTQFSCFLRLSQ